MSIEPNSFEFNLLFALTIILILIKLGLSTYLAKRVINKKKTTGSFEIDFLFGIFLIMLGLLTSRLLYFYYDFYLTLFDPEKLYILPNIIVWKIANFVVSFFFVILLFITDKKLLKFKLKGVIAYFLLITALIQLIYPVYTLEDFQLISAIGMISSLAMLLVPIIFIYIGIKNPKLRTTSLIFVIGIILYFIGATIDSESIIAPLEIFFGIGFRVIVFFLSLVFKIVGLIIITFSASKFYF